MHVHLHKLEQDIYSWKATWKVKQRQSGHQNMSPACILEHASWDENGLLCIDRKHVTTVKIMINADSQWYTGEE